MATISALPLPDRAALEMAHYLLRSTQPLDDMLKSTALRIILKNVAARHMQRRARIDVKKLQSNDVE
jgi:hypothetical protein